MNIQDILEYINNAKIRDNKVLAAFGVVLEHIFNEEKVSAGIFPELDKAEIELLLQRKKLGAVKGYKERLNLGLMDSKQAIEKYMDLRWGVTSFLDHISYDGVIFYNRD